MASKRNQSDRNIEGLTDAEIFAAIHYLDFELRGENGARSYSATAAICLSLMILFLAGTAFILLYYRTL